MHDAIKDLPAPSERLLGQIFNGTFNSLIEQADQQVSWITLQPLSGRGGDDDANDGENGSGAVPQAAAAGWTASAAL